MQFTTYADIGEIRCSRGLNTRIYENGTKSECSSCGYNCTFRRDNNIITHSFKTFNLKCSFCGKSQGEVGKLVAGPGVYICNECIDLCAEIITQDEDSEEIEEIKSYTC